mmetsp:Transcript_57257/g.79430  ORF Transcript_57257/g.79430 Transcript_57257/m.79430 type:complete len:101 (-) Transcript_57257:80-382(-)
MIWYKTPQISEEFFKRAPGWEIANHEIGHGLPRRIIRMKTEGIIPSGSSTGRLNLIDRILEILHFRLHFFLTAHAADVSLASTIKIMVIQFNQWSVNVRP